MCRNGAPLVSSRDDTHSCLRLHVSINAPPHTLLIDAGQRHTMPADTDQWRVVLRKGVQELARAHATCLTIQDLIACTRTRAMLVKSLHTLVMHSLAESSKSVHTQPLPMVAEISIACARAMLTKARQVSACACVRAMPTKAVLCSTACHAAGQELRARTNAIFLGTCELYEPDA